MLSKRVSYIVSAALVWQWHLHVAIGICTQSWITQRDDMAEYRQLASVPAISELQCMLMNITTGADAVSFSPGNHSCQLLVCRLGNFGCRKCRNAKNANLPLLWMRKHSTGSRFCWRSFQRRVDATVDFNRNWNEYAVGFGQGENANFWLGLETLHQLTMRRSRRVRWEFSNWNDIWQWSENPNFIVSDASNRYRVSMGSVDSNRSTIDQFPIPSTLGIVGNMFSTPDSDNDAYAAGSCAAIHQAGWWFNECTFFNPNGKYYQPPEALNTRFSPTRGIYFMPPSQFDSAVYYSMKTFECLIEDWLSV